MSNTPPDPELSEESPSTDSRSSAVRTAVETFLHHARRVLTRDYRATDAAPTPVLITDGGQANAKVIGHNTDSGQTVGVWGEVNSSEGCGLATPDDVRIDGTVLTNETDFTVETGTQSTNDAQPVILGHASNTVADGTTGVTIAGGGFDDGSNDDSHVAYDNYGTISGGRNNQVGTNDDTDQTGGTVGGGFGNTASGYEATVGGGSSNTASSGDATVGGGDANTASAAWATVGGGESNTASAAWAIVGGGQSNTASGQDATVGGGTYNTASGGDATVGGGSSNTASGGDATVGGGGDNTASSFQATVPGGGYGAAESDRSFVWNDGSAYHDIPNSSFFDGLSSDTAVNGEPVTGAETFSVSATEGVRFITGSNKVTYIDGGSTGWSTNSTRTAKTNIEPVDPQQVLDGVEDVEVATWEYKTDDGDGAGTTHVGPMAEEFHSILDVTLGSSDEHINSLNADGTLFAAVQGLAERLNEETDRLAEENEQLTQNLDAKDDRIERLEADRDELEAENDELRERLADIEAHLGVDDSEISTDD